jgi:hypothetical protein
MTWVRPIFCSRCTSLAVVVIEGGRTGRYPIRSAVACERHRAAIERWAARAGRVRVIDVEQPTAKQQGPVQQTLFDLDGTGGTRP